MIESWLPVVGYEGFYEVSTLGHVRSVPRIVLDKRTGTKFQKGMMLRPAIGTQKYPQVQLCREGKSRTMLVHHLVTDAFIGPCPKGKVRRHLDGVHANCVLTNLKYGTPFANIEDTRTHRTMCVGEGHPASTLTEHEVCQIKIRLKSGESGRNVAVYYGISESQVSSIKRGKSWRHVT